MCFFLDAERSKEWPIRFMDENAKADYRLDLVFYITFKSLIERLLKISTYRLRYCESVTIRSINLPSSGIPFSVCISRAIWSRKLVSSRRIEDQPGNPWELVDPWCTRRTCYSCTGVRSSCCSHLNLPGTVVSDFDQSLRRPWTQR